MSGLAVWSLSLMLVLQVSAGYNYTTNYISVPVDHFSFTNSDTFELKYLMNDTYWDAKNGGPIFFYAGNEAPIEDFVENTGFMWEIFKEFKALIVFAEHRYYGESLPYGTESFENKTVTGFLTSQQALADYVDLIKWFRDHFQSNHCRSSPVIVFGGSYGGMLAAWFRIKYPAVVQGAIASSAPIWQFTGMTPCNNFYKVTTMVYKKTHVECSLSISASWKSIDNMAKTETGLKWLTENWNLCEPLESNDVASLKSWASEVYVALAMVNYPYEANFLAPLPGNPIKEVCKSMTNPLADDQTLLKSVFEGLSVYFNYTGTAQCLNISSVYSDEMMKWTYQACTEMIMPMCTKGGKHDMFEPSPWDFEGYANWCFDQYGVRPTTDLVEKQYGGKDLRAASNIVFSNGLLDPWSSGGVLNNVSPSVRAIRIPGAAHHLDLRAAHPQDPQSVVCARREIKFWIKKWIQQHGHH